MTARRLRRYRLVCTVRDARRCRWVSRSWRSTSPFVWADGTSAAGRAHMRLMHPERDDIFDAPRPRRWRPWLRWAALATTVLAALAAVTAAAVSIDVGRWWWP